MIRSVQRWYLAVGILAVFFVSAVVVTTPALAATKCKKTEVKNRSFGKRGNTLRACISASTVKKGASFFRANLCSSCHSGTTVRSYLARDGYPLTIEGINTGYLANASEMPLSQLTGAELKKVLYYLSSLR